LYAAAVLLQPDVRQLMMQKKDYQMQRWYSKDSCKWIISRQLQYNLHSRRRQAAASASHVKRVWSWY